MNPAILVQGVTKTFGTTTAVDDLNLEIPRGTLCGVIGPNGAGKTTTIRMIMSILFPDRGTLSVLGHASALEAKDRIGYLPEERGVYRKMKVGVFLTYMANLKGVSGADLPARITRSLERVGLSDSELVAAASLSGGDKRKLELAMVLASDPHVVLLDEPMAGVSAEDVPGLVDVISAVHRAGKTVLMVEHHIEVVTGLAQRIAVMHHGALLACDTPENVMRNATVQHAYVGEKL